MSKPHMARLMDERDEALAELKEARRLLADARNATAAALLERDGLRGNVYEMLDTCRAYLDADDALGEHRDGTADEATAPALDALCNAAHDRGWTCATCDGTGRASLDFGSKRCPDCAGWGWVRPADAAGAYVVAQSRLFDLEEERDTLRADLWDVLEAVRLADGTVEGEDTVNVTARAAAFNADGECEACEGVGEGVSEHCTECNGWGWKRPEEVSDA